MQYLGGGSGAAELAGGILTLTTELNVPDEAFAMLRERLVQRLGDDVRDALRLAPVLFDDGTVELVALGASSASAGAGDKPAPLAGPFDLHFLGSGKPSLSADNTASFQLMLDATSAELLERALDLPELPVIAIYRMSFAGLRPSFQIDIQADWHKVYQSLQNKAKVNVYYVSADVDVMISQALEENNIRIDTTVFGVGEQAHAAAERARKQLTDWVLEHLFTPMVDPAAALANTLGQVIDDTVWSLTRSLLPGVGYRLRVVDQEQTRFLSARMNEAVAERREVIPQGTLGGFLHRYQVDERGEPNPEWPAIRAALVQTINLDGFPRIEVKVGVEDRFAGDGLTEVRVDLARAFADGNLENLKSLAFRSAAEREDYIVNLLGQAQANFAIPYQYRTQVFFDPAGAFGPHDPVTSQWNTGSTPELIAEPRWAYDIREVHAQVAPIFSFSQFPAISVELHYSTEGEAMPQTGHLLLNEQNPRQNWRFRSFGERPLPFEYRLTYHRTEAAGGDIQGAWQQQIDGWLAIPDPLPVKRALNLFVNLPWPEIAIGFVQLRYDDEPNGIHFDEQIDLNPSIRFLRRDYPIAANGPRALSYRLTMLLTDGQLLEGSWRETEDDRLVLDRRLVDRKAITIRAIGGGLAENKLSAVRVELQACAPDSGQARAETELVLTADGQQLGPWEYLLGDPPARTVRYSALFVDRNGFVQRTPEKTTNADLLVVHLRNKTIAA